MKFPLSWLKEYIELDLSPAEIAKALTSVGVEVDSVESDGQGDTIFEVALTPNLGHCSNLIGIARELSAITGKSVKKPNITVKEADFPAAKNFKISIHDKKGCPRYSARLIKGVAVKPSPEWLQKRLVASGSRPVNNIVDVTNYVLLEMGHPLHAFDFGKLSGHEIQVRAAKSGEKFVTLDHKDRVLAEGDILICDQNKPVTLAGIMGGVNSEVGNETRDILLECAYFSPQAIRRTSKRLGLFTDSSKRFERGSDPNQIQASLDRAADLIQQVAGGEIAQGIVDVKNQEFPEKVIECRLKKINDTLGTALSLSEVETVFQRLGFRYQWDGQNKFHVHVPTFRVDVLHEIDLIEEVARIYGYDNIKRPSLQYRASTIPDAPIYVFEQEVRQRLVSTGLQEFITCDLIGPSLLGIVQESETAPEAFIEVLNPTSVEQSILRTSLLPGLLHVVKYNWDHQNHNVSGFEIGRVHFKEEDTFKEQSVVGIVLTGKAAPYNWENKPSDVDFFLLKGIVESLLQQLNIRNVIYKNREIKSLHAGRQASIYAGELEIGSFGEVHPAIQRRLDVPQKIYFAELNLHDLMQVRQPERKLEELPIYPSSERDWTVTLKDSTPIEELISMVRSCRSRELENVSLLDIYKSDKLGLHLKNVTLRFVYRDKTKTIEQETVDAEHSRIVSEVQRLLT